MLKTSLMDQLSDTSVFQEGAPQPLQVGLDLPSRQICPLPRLFTHHHPCRLHAFQRSLVLTSIPDPLTTLLFMRACGRTLENIEQWPSSQRASRATTTTCWTSSMDAQLWC